MNNLDARIVKAKFILIFKISEISIQQEVFPIQYGTKIGLNKKVSEKGYINN